MRRFSSWLSQSIRNWYENDSFKHEFVRMRECESSERQVVLREVREIYSYGEGVFRRKKVPKERSLVSRERDRVEREVVFETVREIFSKDWSFRREVVSRESDVVWSFQERAEVVS